MRKKLTLTIDAEVYDKIKELPRTVSVSEVVSWLLKTMITEMKKGRELTEKELQEWMDSTPEGKDFRERWIEHWGPGFRKIDRSIEKIKKTVKRKKD